MRTMMSSGSGGHRALRWTAAAGFVFSALYAAWSYAGPFGRAVDAPAGALARTRAIAIDLLLFALFAAHHSVAARPWAKRTISRIVPRTLERTAYVGISSLLLAGTVAAWQAVPGIAWSLSPGFLGWVGSATQLAAAAWMALAFRAIDIRSLAGLDGGPSAHPGKGQVLTRGPFAVVRHPIYLGWMVALWAAPVMTGTRLVFAAASSAYLVVALRWEERDLARDFGPAYRDYCRTVPWRIVPWIWGLVLVAAA